MAVRKKPARKERAPGAVRRGASSHPIVIDADVVPGKSIKSIEVNYKIEYS